MTTAPQCPFSDRLKELCEEGLPAEESAALEGHVEVCTRCQEQLAQLETQLDAAFDVFGPGGQTARDSGVPDTEVRAMGAMRDERSWVDEFRKSFPRHWDENTQQGRFGNYEVVGLLGKGAMGWVYRARRIIGDPAEPHRFPEVAIKVMSPDLAKDEPARRRFRQEAEAVAKLGQAGPERRIVSILDVGEDKQIPYFVMPLLAGQTLKDRLAAIKENRAQMPFQEIVGIGKGIALGLEQARCAGLVHRDVKPSNVWLLDNAQSFENRVLLLDFGLVRPLEDSEATRLTGSQILGTPDYMAPEQARGDPTIDYRADLFSLGCVLYEMCTLRQPFSGSTVVDVLVNVLGKEPKPIRRLNPAVPPGLVNIVNELLAKDREDRYQSAGEVARLLRRLQRPTPVPLDDGLWKWLRRRVLIVVVVLVIIGALPLPFVAKWLWQSGPPLVTITGPMVIEFSEDFDHGNVPGHQFGIFRKEEPETVQWIEQRWKQVKRPDGKSMGALELRYAVPHEYNGWWLKLGDADWSRYAEGCLILRLMPGPDCTPKFKVELKTAHSRQVHFVYVRLTEDDRKASAAQGYVDKAVPISSFGLEDLSRMQELTIVFESHKIDSEYQKGTFLLHSIMLSENPPEQDRNSG